MILNLSGLSFRAHSPSILELVSVRRDVDPQARVFVWFDGLQWAIDYRSPRGSICRSFKTRDAAVALIASRAS